MTKIQHQSGAVSLFIVIFTALLVMVLSVSFVRLMLQDQQQATTVDLSQSAFDSAQAGVEDAKRALLRYQHACTTGNGEECNRLRQAFGLTDADKTCDTLAKASVAGETGSSETMIQQTTGDANLDQAYTCVKISLDTADYVGELRLNESKVIPLRATGSFDAVELSWFDSRDLSGSGWQHPPAGVTLPATWPTRTPPLLRAQLMQHSGSFTLDQFDSDEVGGSNAKTLFLRPVRSGGLNRVEFARYGRQANNIEPSGVDCTDIAVSGGYSCKVKLLLPNPIGGDAGSRTAYLRLSAPYNGTHYSLRLLSGDSSVNFEGVQPKVDSTGRANDLFRRVESRVELQDATFPYPEAAVDITGNLCKEFTITNQPDGYSSSCSP